MPWRASRTIQQDYVTFSSRSPISGQKSTSRTISQHGRCRDDSGGDPLHHWAVFGRVLPRRVADHRRGRPVAVQQYASVGVPEADAGSYAAVKIALTMAVMLEFFTRFGASYDKVLMRDGLLTADEFQTRKAELLALARR